MTNWPILISLMLISVGGLIASTYETFARKNFLPVGESFSRKGFMNILGGYLGLGAIIASPFFNPWWTLFIIMLCAWLFSQALIQILKKFSQYFSLIIIIFGTVLFIVNLI